MKYSWVWYLFIIYVVNYFQRKEKYPAGNTIGEPDASFGQPWRYTGSSYIAAFLRTSLLDLEFL